MVWKPKELACSNECNETLRKVGRFQAAPRGRLPIIFTQTTGPARLQVRLSFRSNGCCFFRAKKEVLCSFPLFLFVFEKNSMSSVIVTNQEETEAQEMEETEETKVDATEKKEKPKRKGRGFARDKAMTDDERYGGKAAPFESFTDDNDTDAQKSVEGWIIFVTGVHEEAQEDDLYELFADHGEIKQLHLNLERRTGYVKGYALIEFEKYQEAKAAIDALNGQKLLEQKISVDWAFKRPPARGAASGRPERAKGGRR